MTHFYKLIHFNNLALGELRQVKMPSFHTFLYEDMKRLLKFLPQSSVFVQREWRQVRLICLLIG